MLICEGEDDKSFFHRLIEERGIQPFAIWEARARGDKSAGITGFKRALQAFQIERTQHYAALTDIVLVADNDEQPTANFNLVCKQVREAIGQSAAPSAPLVKTKNRPAITIVMLPWTGVQGHLEALCVKAANDAAKTMGDNTNSYLALAGEGKWDNASRSGKAWIRANLATRCARDPGIPLGLLFRNEPQLIPVSHSSFDQLASFLNAI